MNKILKCNVYISIYESLNFIALSCPVKCKHHEKEDTRPLLPASSPAKHRISLYQLQERHLYSDRHNTSHPSETRPSHLSQNFQSRTTHARLSGDNHAVIFPECRDENKLSRPLSSRQFAEEFHQSVLQTTRQQELGKNGQCF